MNFALTVAGFDGCAGAGILADVKAMFHFGVYGEAVCTALTVQNESKFVSPGWVPWESIESQLETLFEKHVFRYVKIGLVENAETLGRIVEFIRKKSPEAFILWDPIASATAGFQFMQTADLQKLLPVLKKIDLITPNQDEFSFLGLGLAYSRKEIDLGNDFAVLLKGGHSVDADAVDTLWSKGEVYKFRSPRVPGAGKHGTGCNLSSAIVANLACGRSLPEACQAAKDYMDAFLKSGMGRLGFVNP